MRTDPEWQLPVCLWSTPSTQAAMRLRAGVWGNRRRERREGRDGGVVAQSAWSCQ